MPMSGGTVASEALDPEAAIISRMPIAKPRRVIIRARIVHDADDAN